MGKGIVPENAYSLVVGDQNLIDETVFVPLHFQKLKIYLYYYS
jgi:hypothetical protein